MAKYPLRMVPMAFLLLISFVHGVQASAIPQAEPTQASADDKFNMLSIGDSWAAGAAGSVGNLYDSIRKCWRYKRAWEVQMAEDRTWTEKPIDFKFRACSGARLIAAAKGDDAVEEKGAQIDGTGKPRLLTMELGGNNCHFFEIAKTCIYGGNLFDFQEYPNPSSSCTQALARCEAYLLNSKDQPNQSFYFDHHNALRDIMNSTGIKGREDFYFYIVGYAEFFNTSPGSRWCDRESFGVLHRPRLSNALRSKINKIVRDLNARTAKSVADMNISRIRFFDPSPLFEGHRFCEPGHTLNNQYFLNDVWFWNLTPTQDGPMEWQDLWIRYHIFPNGTQASMEDVEELLGGFDPYSSGKTFHPKDGAHKAIKEALISTLRKDRVPGVKQVM